MKHPIQPLYTDAQGVTRFKENAIVRFLLDEGPFDLNTIAVGQFSQEDREQFAQLIGYSLSGFSELSYASNATYETAVNMYASGASERDARIAHMETTLTAVRKGLREIVPEVFRIHPADLEE